MGGGDDGGEDSLSPATVDVEGGQRPYYLHVPANLTKPAPVVFVLHGGGGRPQAIARRTDWTQAADQHGFVVVFPEGSASPSGRGGTWNVGSGWTSASSDDIGYVAAILKDIGHNVQVDPTRVYATGVSMGGVLSYRLACEMSDTFAAIAPVSATMVEPDCKPTSPVAILHIHGTDDDRIPLHGGHGQKTASKRSWPAPEKGIAAWSHFDACADAAPPHSTEGGADCESFQQCRAPVEMCVLSGGSHGWPEGATDQIWAFFAAHPKPAP